jgi:hypothetical protein
VAGSTTIDGTARFVAVLAPDVRTLGTANHYYMPVFRVNITGQLTNANPQQQNFTCWDVICSATGSTFTSGQWASDGVTPLYDGLHFCATRVGFNGPDDTTGGFQLQQNSQCTFIGGEVQVAGAVGFGASSTPRSYKTRWRNTKDWGGVTSSRFRAYSTTAIFRDCEFYDMAYDLFRMPAEFSVVARGSEYLAQYVGGAYGGADAKFVASNLENVDGVYEFDNFGSGWVELYNCKQGAALRVVSQNTGTPATLARHCVPLYQDLIITAKDTTGANVQDVRFTATEIPANPPTATITTIGNLKTWDFRTALTYQTTTNASGVALSSPVLNVWYWQTGRNFQQSLRFPSSTATYEGRAYNYKTMTVSAVLGASAAIPVSAGMIGLDTATTITETAALALTGITLTPSGATGGSIVISSDKSLQDIWNYYRAWISAFANRASNDTWTCLGGQLSVGAWTVTVNSGVTLSPSANITSLKTTTTVTNNGTITAIYQDSNGTSTTWEFQDVEVGTSLAIYDGSGVTKYFQGEVATAGTYRYYIPPMATGVPYTYAIEKYGTRRETGTFPSNAGGVLFYVPSYAEDVGITQTTQATVAAYTAIENEDKFYDYTAYKRLSETFIKLGQLTTRDGTKLVIDAGYSVVVNQSNASVESVSGSTITIKSTSYGGGAKYSTTKLTPPATFTANSTEVISGNIEDGNGDSSLTIVGGDDLGYELWKVTTSTATADYATGTLLNDTILKGQKYRFIGISGYDIVGVDTNSNVRRRSSMAYGVYTQSFYVGDQIQLADDAPSLQALTTEIQILKVSVEAMPTDFLAETVETGATVAQSLRLANSVLGGKVSGAGTGTETFRDLADTKDRVISTVTPEGNRTDEVYDLD